MEYDIVVIGGGPAGLTAALYGLRAGKNVLVLEGKALGGQIVNAQDVQNYPGIASISGVELTKNMYEQVMNFGGEVKYEKVIKIEKGEEEEKSDEKEVMSGRKKEARTGRSFLVKTDGGEYRARVIIIATGAENKKLGLAREQELTGRGISYCATCDGNFYKGKSVVVIGGGNTALEDAIYLSDVAKKVYLVHRRNEFRGDKANVEKVKKCDNVELVLEANAKEIMGENKVEGLKVVFNDGREEILDVDGVFIAVGYTPQNEMFADMVKLDNDGYIEACESAQGGDRVHTSVKGIYVAGDARAKDLKQLTTAVSDGSIAATTAVKEMENA